MGINIYLYSLPQMSFPLLVIFFGSTSWGIRIPLLSRKGGLTKERLISGQSGFESLSFPNPPRRKDSLSSFPFWFTLFPMTSEQKVNLSPEGRGWMVGWGVAGWCSAVPEAANSIFLPQVERIGVDVGLYLFLDVLVSRFSESLLLYCTALFRPVESS